MKSKIVLGITAHVDAGKTTLSEAMLYLSGRIRHLGRVDHKDAFLDTDTLERERGITIFSKQAVFPLGDTSEVTLLDTPGHVDFSTEMERVLSVLDCAILVISGAAGVQAHTLTLWRLLERYGVPVFLFINKMDTSGIDRSHLLAQLRSQLGENCVDFSAPTELLCEEAAMCDEAAMEQFLTEGTLDDATLRSLVSERKIFPCCFGSALKLDGVEELLSLLDRLAPRREYPDSFGAQVYKISRDSQGKRLTHLKVTGGTLRVKQVLTGGSGEAAWEEKVDQIRIYSGTKFQTADEAGPGSICAVTGLTHTESGMGLGSEENARAPSLEPVLNYQLILPDGVDAAVALPKLKQLQEEDPQLHITWNQRLQEIHILLMGQVQLEILQRVIAERFGMAVEFGTGSIVYKETIAAAVEGVGHYEPLRHYAETHLLLEPLPRGSGLQFATVCSEDALDRNWQRLILTHLMEKPHLGVLTGSPITDMRLTLTAGRAHLKHTEGGDFRQATYRAVRQGLMSAESILLEPWYDFRLEIPGENLGRAINDIQQMSGRFDAPETIGDTALITGSAPVSAMSDYWQTVTAYSRGRGRLTCTVRGYEPCHNAGEVIAAIGYEAEHDTENSPDSVFCAHGAGYTVKWSEVPAMAHVDSGISLTKEESAPAAPAPKRRAVSYASSREEEKELQAIFERTYGEVKRRDFQPTPRRPAEGTVRRTVPPRNTGPEYLLVDGYNIIHAWDELKEMARTNLESARRMLMDILLNYQGFKKCIVILVFDAYKVKGNPGSVEKWHDLNIVYTREAETADTYIERATYDLAKEHRVRVATSDNLEQMIIIGHGAVRVSAREFKLEIEEAEGRISELIEKNNRSNREMNSIRNRATIKSDPNE